MASALTKTFFIGNLLSLLPDAKGGPGLLFLITCCLSIR